jgi:hypothetical protein
VIVFATRAGLAARRDVVEVLHLSGAERRLHRQPVPEPLRGHGALAGLLGGAGAAMIGAAARYFAGGGEGLTPVLPWPGSICWPPCPARWWRRWSPGSRPRRRPGRDDVKGHAVKSIAALLIVVMVWGVGLLAFAGRVEQSTPPRSRPSPTPS